MAECDGFSSGTNASCETAFAFDSCAAGSNSNSTFFFLVPRRWPNATAMVFQRHERLLSNAFTCEFGVASCWNQKKLCPLIHCVGRTTTTVTNGKQHWSRTAQQRYSFVGCHPPVGWIRSDWKRRESGFIGNRGRPWLSRGTNASCENALRLNVFHGHSKRIVRWQPKTKCDGFRTKR